MDYVISAVDKIQDTLLDKYINKYIKNGSLKDFSISPTHISKNLKIMNFINKLKKTWYANKSYCTEDIYYPSISGNTYNGGFPRSVSDIEKTCFRIFEEFEDYLKYIDYFMVYINLMNEYKYYIKNCISNTTILNNKKTEHYYCKSKTIPMKSFCEMAGGSLNNEYHVLCSRAILNIICNLNIFDRPLFHYIPESDINQLSNYEWIKHSNLDILHSTLNDFIDFTNSNSKNSWGANNSAIVFWNY